MALSDMKVFNSFLYEPTYEKVAQMVEKFNANSNGAITLASVANIGDYAARMFWKNLGAAQYRRDAYNGGTQALTQLQQEQWDSVKVAGGFGPVEWEPGQLSWIQRAPAEAIEVISTAVAEEIVKDQLNTVILALTAAIGNNADATNDVSATSVITQSVLNDSMAKFGDHSMNLAAHIMTGTQYHNLIGQAIDNSNNLFEIGGVAVREGTAFGQGRPIIVTDAPALRTANPFQKVLTLSAGAGIVEDNQDFLSRVFEPIGETGNNQNLKTLYQNNYTFNLRLKGYSWDRSPSGGGASPDDAKIGTGANWPSVVDSVKHTAGVLTIGLETPAAP